MGEKPRVARIPSWGASEWCLNASNLSQGAMKLDRSAIKPFQNQAQRKLKSTRCRSRKRLFHPVTKGVVYWKPTKK